MLRNARAEDEQALFPIYTHELVERFLTFDGVDERRFGEIFRELLARLEQDGALRIELMAEADNPRGIAFYRKLGFEQEGVQRKAYKRAAESSYVDEVMMVKFVGELA